MLRHLVRRQIRGWIVAYLYLTTAVYMVAPVIVQMLASTTAHAQDRYQRYNDNEHASIHTEIADLSRRMEQSEKLVEQHRTWAVEAYRDTTVRLNKLETTEEIHETVVKVFAIPVFLLFLKEAAGWFLRKKSGPE